MDSFFSCFLWCGICQIVREWPRWENNPLCHPQKQDRFILKTMETAECPFYLVTLWNLLIFHIYASATKYTSLDPHIHLHLPCPPCHQPRCKNTARISPFNCQACKYNYVFVAQDISLSRIWWELPWDEPCLIAYWCFPAVISLSPQCKMVSCLSGAQTIAWFHGRTVFNGYYVTP